MVASTRPPISRYCPSEAAGWERLPLEILPFPRADWPYICSFLRQRDGVQMLATVTDSHIIHVSIAPIKYYCPDLSDAEISDHLDAVTPEVLETFFEKLEFKRKPEDPKNPQVKHYFGSI